MKPTTRHALTATLGLVAAPFYGVRAVAWLVHEISDTVHAVRFVRGVHEEGFVCPEGHVRPLDPADRFECPDCHAVSRDHPPWLACPVCHSPPPSFIYCDCSLAIALPRVPGLLGWVLAGPRNPSVAPRDPDPDVEGADE